MPEEFERSQSSSSFAPSGSTSTSATSQVSSPIVHLLAGSMAGEDVCRTVRPPANSDPGAPGVRLNAFFWCFWLPALRDVTFVQEHCLNCLFFAVLVKVGDKPTFSLGARL